MPRSPAFDPVFKVNPPLRSEGDVGSIRRGVVDGTVDAIATDHAPHPPEAKDLPFDEAPPGMLGLETALSVAFTVFYAAPLDGSVTDGSQAWAVADRVVLSAQQLFALFSWRPAAIAGLDAPGEAIAGHSAHGGPLVPTAVANLCVFDPSASFRVDAGALASLSRNTPYAGHELRGRVRHTVLRGEPVVIDAMVQR